MELKELLTEIGYSENQIENITSKKKVYFQEDLDNIVEKSKSNIESKIKDKYIAKEEYDLLNSNFSTLNKQVKTNSIKEIYSKIGGKDGKEFDSFIKLNEDLLEVEAQHLEKALSQKANDYEWAFHKNNQDTNFTNEKDIFNSLKNDDNNSDLISGTIYRDTNK